MLIPQQAVPIEKVEGLQQVLRERENQERTEGSAYQAVGSDGKLGAVRKHSSYTTPSAFPTITKVVNSSTSVTMDSNGIEIHNGTNYVRINFVEFGEDCLMREWAVCNSGAPATARFLSSAPY